MSSNPPRRKKYFGQTDEEPAGRVSITERPERISKAPIGPDIGYRATTRGAVTDVDQKQTAPATTDRPTAGPIQSAFPTITSRMQMSPDELEREKYADLPNWTGEEKAKRMAYASSLTGKRVGDRYFRPTNLDHPGYTDEQMNEPTSGLTRGAAAGVSSVLETLPGANAVYNASIDPEARERMHRYQEEYPNVSGAARMGTDIAAKSIGFALGGPGGAGVVGGLQRLGEPPSPEEERLTGEDRIPAAIAHRVLSGGGHGALTALTFAIMPTTSKYFEGALAKGFAPGAIRSTAAEGFGLIAAGTPQRRIEEGRYTPTYEDVASSFAIPGLIHAGKAALNLRPTPQIRTGGARIPDDTNVGRIGGKEATGPAPVGKYPIPMDRQAGVNMLRREQGARSSESPVPTAKSKYPRGAGRPTLETHANEPMGGATQEIPEPGRTTTPASPERATEAGATYFGNEPIETRGQPRTNRVPTTEIGPEPLPPWARPMEEDTWARPLKTPPQTGAGTAETPTTNTPRESIGPWADLPERNPPSSMTGTITPPGPAGRILGRSGPGNLRPKQQAEGMAPIQQFSPDEPPPWSRLTQEVPKEEALSSDINANALLDRLAGLQAGGEVSDKTRRFAAGSAYTKSALEGFGINAEMRAALVEADVFRKTPQGHYELNLDLYPELKPESVPPRRLNKEGSPGRNVPTQQMPQMNPRTLSGMPSKKDQFWALFETLPPKTKAKLQADPAFPDRFTIQGSKKPTIERVLKHWENPEKMSETEKAAYPQELQDIISKLPSERQTPEQRTKNIQEFPALAANREEVTGSRGEAADWQSSGKSEREMRAFFERTPDEKLTPTQHAQKQALQRGDTTAKARADVRASGAGKAVLAKNRVTAANQIASQYTEDGFVEAAKNLYRDFGSPESIAFDKALRQIGGVEGWKEGKTAAITDKGLRSLYRAAKTEVPPESRVPLSKLHTVLDQMPLEPGEAPPESKPKMGRPPKEKSPVSEEDAKIKALEKKANEKGFYKRGEEERARKLNEKTTAPKPEAKPAVAPEPKPEPGPSGNAPEGPTKPDKEFAPGVRTGSKVKYKGGKDAVTVKGEATDYKGQSIPGWINVEVNGVNVPKKANEVSPIEENVPIEKQPRTQSIRVIHSSEYNDITAKREAGKPLSPAEKSLYDKENQVPRGPMGTTVDYRTGPAGAKGSKGPPETMELDDVVRADVNGRRVEGRVAEIRGDKIGIQTKSGYEEVQKSQIKMHTRVEKGGEGKKNANEKIVEDRPKRKGFFEDESGFVLNPLARKQAKTHGQHVETAIDKIHDKSVGEERVHGLTEILSDYQKRNRFGVGTALRNITSSAADFTAKEFERTISAPLDALIQRKGDRSVAGPSPLAFARSIGKGITKGAKNAYSMAVLGEQPQSELNRFKGWDSVRDDIANNLPQKPPRNATPAQKQAFYNQMQTQYGLTPNQVKSYDRLEFLESQHKKEMSERGFNDAEYQRYKRYSAISADLVKEGIDPASPEGEYAIRRLWLMDPTHIGQSKIPGVTRAKSLVSAYSHAVSNALIGASEQPMRVAAMTRSQQESAKLAAKGSKDTYNTYLDAINTRAEGGRVRDATGQVNHALEKEADIMLAKSIAYGEEVTFANDNRASKFIAGMRERAYAPVEGENYALTAAKRTGGILVDQIAPYPKANTNVWNAVLSRLPGAGALWDGAWATGEAAANYKGLKAKGQTKNLFNDAFSKSVRKQLVEMAGRQGMGVALLYAGYKLAESDWLTQYIPYSGFSNKDKDKHFAEEASRRPNGSFYLPYFGRVPAEIINPLSNILHVGAELFRIHNGENGTTNMLYDYMQTLASGKTAEIAFMQQPMMEGARNTAAELFKEGDESLRSRAVGMAATAAADLVPKPVSSVAKATDIEGNPLTGRKIQREPERMNRDILGSFWDRFQMNVPGLRQNVPEKHDVMGHTVTKETGPIDTVLRSESQERTDKLYRVARENEVGFDKPVREKDESNADYQKRLEKEGQIYEYHLRNLVDHPVFDKVKDWPQLNATKKEIIQYMFKLAKSDARQARIDHDAEDYYDKTLEHFEQEKDKKIEKEKGIPTEKDERKQEALKEIESRKK